MKATCLCVALFVCTAMQAQTKTEPSRMDRSRLNIGAYCLASYAWTDQHVKDIKDCGIDFMTVIPNDKKILDLLHKHGVGADVSGVVPGWWGGDGKNGGQFSKTHPIETYEKAAASFADHPAIWCIDLGDEPSALDFPHYGKVFKCVEERFPSHITPYLNLYPNYASVSQNTSEQVVSQLGTRTYQEHIAEYVKHVPSDYICYDHYLYSLNVPLAYNNLRIVSDACTGSERSMWIVLQVNSNKKDKFISENELRFQAYTAMAFGAENIIWACWTAGWWYNNVLDSVGNKTEQYDKLQRVNKEIHLLGQPYMKYRRTGTHFISFQGTKWLEGVGQVSEPQLNDGFIQNLTSADHSPLVVGTMNSRAGDGSRALFVCSADDPYDEHPAEHKITFRADGMRISATGPQGPRKVEVASDGTYSIPIRSNEGILIEAVKY